MSFRCRLCGLTLDEIPDDAIQIGKIYRFMNGEHHDLRKQLEPRTGPRPRRKINPDRESPASSEPPPVMGRTAREVPEYVEPSIPVVEENVNEVPAGETAMSRAFRLKKVA
jgi:hypothetical protein